MSEAKRIEEICIMQFLSNKEFFFHKKKSKTSLLTLLQRHKTLSAFISFLI